MLEKAAESVALAVGYTVCLAVLLRMVLWLKRIVANRQRIPLRGKWVVITGCDSGFGQALAVRLTQQGCKVFASCLSEEGAAKLKTLCPDHLEVHLLDLSKEQSIEAFVTALRSVLKKEQLYGLVNNAGIGSGGTAELCSMREYRYCADVNLFGPIHLTKALLPLLRASKGRIVNVSSIAGRVACAISGPYAVTKHGVEAFSDALRREVYGFGVKVSIVEPGAFKTEIVNRNRLAATYKAQWDSATDDQRAAYDGYLPKIQKGAEMLENAASKNIDEVVAQMEDGLSLPEPCVRQCAGLDAKILWIPLSYMPEWLADWILRQLDKLV
eukprot:m.101085 g.101085  ORF g.101085 m.101085 type:complete len:327 (+) comp15644_c0_seq1:202-1182(+)